MTELKSAGRTAEQSQPSMWAKVGKNDWFAIPPQMAESFRKAGAEVRQAHELSQ